MPRMSHGSTVSLEKIQATLEAIEALNNSLESPIALVVPRRLNDFDYMFPDLQRPEALLPSEDPELILNLKRLGGSMRERIPEDVDGDNGSIPAAYTYLGQFIDHDITLEALSDSIAHISAHVLALPVVLSKEEVLERIKNQRTATLDLDSVYETPAPFDGDKMILGKVSDVPGGITGNGIFHDLPRSDRDRNNFKFDRFALIGDARNDENLIVAQLHVAFLRAHNALVDKGLSWERARSVLRQLYQWVVVEDFLRKIAGDAIVDDILTNGTRFFRPSPEKFFMPLEFAVAGFRFGHSMIRSVYDFNAIFRANSDGGTLENLFTFTALSGNLVPLDPTTGLPDGDGFDTLPSNWIIQWDKFVNDTPNPTRKINTRLVKELFKLPNQEGSEQPGTLARLAVRNLLRGLVLRMPTGQAVAEHMLKITPLITPLKVNDLQALIDENAEGAGMTDDDKEALKNSGFSSRTPLWFYVLAEAELLNEGKHLGPVGGIIVAEVLIQMARQSTDSYFNLGDGWNPSHLNEELGTEFPESFDLRDLLKLAGVL